MPPDPRKLGPGPCTGADRHGADRVQLLTVVGNAPSQGVARRAGFRPTGRARGALSYPDGSTGDAEVFVRRRTG